MNWSNQRGFFLIEIIDESLELSSAQQRPQCLPKLPIVVLPPLQNTTCVSRKETGRLPICAISTLAWILGKLSLQSRVGEIVVRVCGSVDTSYHR